MDSGGCGKYRNLTFLAIGEVILSFPIFPSLTIASKSFAAWHFPCQLSLNMMAIIYDNNEDRYDFFVGNKTTYYSYPDVPIFDDILF